MSVVELRLEARDAPQVKGRSAWIIQDVGLLAKAG
jgi:hypothetical protein